MQESTAIRLAKLEDLTLYFKWVNEPSVRKNSIDTGQISLVLHEKWFLNKLNSDNSILLVLELNEVPIGQLRFDIEDEIVLIDYSIDQEFRLRGFGNLLIQRGIDYFMKISKNDEKDFVFRGIVKRINTASIKVFIKNGFLENKKLKYIDKQVFEMKLSKKK